ncbi:MAG: DUF559 domain-containing protein [Vicingaceae bacterium]
MPVQKIAAALNKAFLKVKPNRSQIEEFKINLIQLLDRANDNESEEFHKTLVRDFLKKTYYDPQHFINTKGRNDLVIHNGNKASSSVGVIIEAKKPSNKSGMPSQKKLNTKAFHELLLYFLRERILEKNVDVKNLIATNLYEWFVFDANEFEKLFVQDKKLVKQFEDFEAGRLSGQNTDFFYREIAEPAIAKAEAELHYTYVDIRQYEKPLRNDNPKDDAKLIKLYKLLSPEHMLKLPFANDSNSLDKKFYGELLHIIGLTETKQGSKKLIERNKSGERNQGSLLENAIIQLETKDIISHLPNYKAYGYKQEERLFNVGLELSITWINRILFLKLLEAQLLTYHQGDESYNFLSFDKIANCDALEKLFFQVLAKQYSERSDLVKDKFAQVPYLNSSLFEPSEIERNAIYISNLEDDYEIPIYASTVLKDSNGKKRSGKLNSLQYLFEFLSAYDFSSEGAEEIQEDNKSLINASVLGLIFEKINGYKDGSFFTPGFITMYMCRETIRKAVLQKFKEQYKWNCKDFNELKEDLNELVKQGDRKAIRKEANALINSLKICDPAVGSGHFLVSALNEIIAVKSELKILFDQDFDPLSDYEVSVVNDELIVTDLEGELFEYRPFNKECQKIQQTLFHEKQTIIENCLFGVDLNPNSVKICRLRLWIELLKSAYYKSSPPSKGGVPEGGGGLNNLPYLKTFRKTLRNNLTPAEAQLWKLLKGKQLDGRKFRRQHSVANYILDFYCPEERLAIELDGQGHFEATQAEYDRERDLFLENVGIRVLRFENKWVWDRPEALLEQVKSYFGKQPPRQPQADIPPSKGGKNQPPRPTDTPPSKGGELRELETLPNIDINIKCGNSLISRFDLDADLRKVLKESKYSIDSYKVAVDTYRNASSKEQKREMEALIEEIKSDFRTEIGQNSKEQKQLDRLGAELYQKYTAPRLLDVDLKRGDKKKQETARKKLEKKINSLKEKIDNIKNNTIYQNAFEWRFEFPEVLNDEGDFLGFDVVIGNPPYFSMSKLKEHADFFSNAEYETYTKGADIYCLFYEIGGRILKANGFLTYITSNSWLRAIYGEQLKDHFMQVLQPISLLNIEDVQIFEEATVESNIITLQKRKLTDTFPVVNLSNDYTLGDSLSEYFNLNHFEFNVPDTSEWFIGNQTEGFLKTKIETRGKQLKDFDVRINRGITTGFNNAFIIDKEKKEELFQLDSKNMDLIKPVLRGRDLKSYSYKFQNFYLINSHNGLKSTELNRVNIEKDYPSIFKHFEMFLPKIKERYDQGDHWTNLRNCTYLEDFEKPKIVWGELSNKAKFTFDDNCHYLNNTVFMMVGEKLKYLLAIMNSSTAQWYFETISTTSGMGTNRWLKYKIELLTVIVPTENQEHKIETLVDQILALKKEDPAADTTALEAEIDALVYELYGLSEEEIRIVEESISK